MDTAFVSWMLLFLGYKWGEQKKRLAYQNVEIMWKLHRLEGVSREDVFA